jgi:hypothetical protein
MPGGDRTGPYGRGPMTGRALGYCAGYPAPGYMNPAPGRGWARGWGRGFGRGFGRGWGRGYWGYPYAAWPPYQPAPYYPGTTAFSAKDELAMLKDEAEQHEEMLGEIRKRIDALEAEIKKED